LCDRVTPSGYIAQVTLRTNQAQIYLTAYDHGLTWISLTDAFRFGLRGRELVQTVGKGMLQGGGTFGMFMAVGTAIRC
uniref:Reactive oxygen species modulator 1 n=1 Tax=Echinostoma caproni TaxID=27848 RepID=A0A183AF36_9TREM